MLKQRVLTALFLIPVFVLLLFFLPPTWFCIFTGAFTVLAAYEWSGLMGVKAFPRSIFYPIWILLALILSLILYVPFILYTAAGWWLIATLLVILYPKGSQWWGKNISVRVIMGMLVLMPCWVAINFLRQANGPVALLFLFVLIWGADSAAYFVGKKWGKHKLAPLVSPGKTWQGFAGALISTLLITLIALLIFKIPQQMWCAVFLLSLLTVIFSVIGDLFESMLKRKANVKDSGTLFPGHGGILDRIDSLTAAAPIFVLGVLILGKIYH